MTRNRSLASVAALAVLVVVLPAGCGVPVDDRARAVAPPPVPWPTPTATDTTAPTAPTGREEEVLYFVRDNRLVPVVRRVHTVSTVDAHLQHLLAGPLPQEREQGLTSALPGTVIAAVARRVGTRAEVDVREPGQETGRSDGVLAFGQIVQTLASRDDIDSVTFTRNGRPLGIPRADGSLSEQPLTAADYADLSAPK